MQYQNGSLHLTAFEPGPDGGEIRWSHKRAVSLTEEGAAGQDRSLGVQDTFQGISAHTTGTQSVLYTRMLDQVLALNPGQDGEEIWSETVGAFDAQTNASFGGLALGDNAFYATSTETLYRYDTNPHHNRWRTVLDPSYDEKWANGDIILADETLYAAAEWRHGNGTSIYAVDAETGDILWRKPIPSDPAIAEQKPWRLFHYISVADGLLVAAGGDGTLWVLGETDASIAPAVKVSSAYPGPGEEVDVDLSGSGPGLQGNVTRYKADWGDGNTTGWQTDPVLTYAYTAPGDRTARFWVGNDANQTSSVTHTFHVGQEAPTEPNMVETAFARENQDLTFGVLGILVAVTGGAIGVARRYRERSRLQEELEAIEHLFEATRDRPAECEAQLTERKAHCRGLLTDGYLTEEQFQVVQTRVEELKQELRRGAVEDEFAFLPHGLVREAREMLHDGRVTSLEARAFLTALEESEVVTDEQRALVRDRIEAWYARDAGGGGRP